MQQASDLPCTTGQADVTDLGLITCHECDSHDYRNATILVRHNISESHTLNCYIEELGAVVEEIARPDLKGYVLGRNLMVNAAAESLLEAQATSLGILLLTIFVSMSAMFTSVKGGLIAMVPSLIPIILVFGAMGLLHIPLNPGTAMVAVIAIGIAVDGTIHLLSRYNELCRRTSDFESAVKTTVQNVSVLRYDLERIRKDLEYFPGIVAKLNFNISAILGTRLAEHMKMLEGHSEDLGQVTPKGSS